MEFIELTRLLFNNHMLASEGTVNSVLGSYELAIEHKPEFVGVVQKPLASRENTARIFKSGKNQVGLIQVKGALTYQETGWEALCGMSSYEAMQANAEYMIKTAQVDEILLEVNSGGGQAYGCFEAAQAVRDMADEAGIKITAYVDGVAFSGGYAWACIADTLIMNPMAKVGSIGVVLPLVNYAEADKKAGIKRVYVTSGKSKVPYDENGDYTKEALADMQKQSQEIYKMFVDHVAQSRGIDTADVENTEAKTFTTNDAIKLGLADEVMTKVEFYKHFESLHGEGIMTVKTNAPTQGDEIKTPALVTQLNAELEKAQTELSTATASVADLTTQVSTLTTSVSAKDTEIEALKQQVKDAQDAVAKLNTEARESKVKALVSADDLESAMVIAEGLSDEKFDVYLSTLQTKADKAAIEMKEVGVTGKDTDEPEISAEEKMLARVKARQNPKA